MTEKKEEKKLLASLQDKTMVKWSDPMAIASKCATI